MSPNFFYPGGNSLETDSRLPSLLARFGTRKTAQTTVDQSKHPPMFGLKYSQLLSRSFNCQFEPTKGDLQIHSPLSVYIENIVLTTGLPFAVTVASLIILQRMYTRLPPNAYKHRAECTPHRLFSGAYILAAKQYVYMEHTIEQTHLQPLSDLPARSWTILSNAYWAQISSYDVAEVQQLQKQILFVVGRSVVVFPIADAPAEAYVNGMNSLPLCRNLPDSKDDTLRNLSRMTWDESYQYFVEYKSLGGEGHCTETVSSRPVPGWWNRRALSRILSINNHHRTRSKQENFSSRNFSN
ncbi:hypothetical protein BJ912DRAFT_555276 [Pholiota molesta]|nr:hypothetical protein BJ912DRAFT_555276 [Pholiota molesta]